MLIILHTVQLYSDGGLQFAPSRYIHLLWLMPSSAFVCFCDRFPVLNCALSRYS